MPLSAHQLAQLAARAKPRPLIAPPVLPAAPLPPVTQPLPERLVVTKPGEAPRPPIRGTLTLRSLCGPQPQPVPVKPAASSDLDQVKALERQLSERWPAVFNPTAPVPLKIGIHHDIRAAMPEVDPRLLAWALGWFVSRPAYQAAILIAGNPRCDLQGCQCGVVTEDEVERLLTERRRAAQKLASRFTEQQRRYAHKGGPNDRA